jgi:formate dehydrogenase major subunit
VIEKHGPEKIAFIGSTRCSNEDNYLMTELARAVIGTSNVDAGGRLDLFPILDALEEVGGGAKATLDQIEEADILFVIGSDLSGSSPMAASRVFRALERHAELVVVDPRTTALANLARHHLRVYPGTDRYWMRGMMAWLMRAGRIDPRFGPWAKSLFHFSLPNAEEISRVPVITMETMAERLARARKAVFMLGTGIKKNGEATKHAVHDLVRLAGISGHAETQGSGILVVGGDNNTQGAWDMGRSRQRNESFPGPPKGKPDQGMDYTQVIDALLAGELRALYVMGDDLPASRTPLREALSALDLFVVQDIFRNDLTDLATVVFPASSSFERAGSFTNLERRVQWFEPILDPLENTRPDWDILGSLARSLNSDLFFRDVSEVTDEIASQVPRYRDIGSARLEKTFNGILCASAGQREPRKEIMENQENEPVPAPSPGGEFPLLLLSGRDPWTWGTGTRSSRITLLAREATPASLHLHPDDARSLGVRQGSKVRIVWSLGMIETPTTLCDDVPRGVAYMPTQRVDGAFPLRSKRALPVRIETC